MAGRVKAIPEGFHTVSAHLVVSGAAKAIDFYKKAFGAEEIFRMPGPDGQSVMHAELRIGDSIIMMCEEFPQMCKSPKSLGGSPVTLHLYVNDADAALAKASAAGCEVTMPLADMFWGDRYGKVRDPFGHEWSIATHVEDVSPEECAKRCAAAFGGKSCG
ncbi:MAG: VOC family protein [Phycisphaerales bacterium]|nr:VOC family protein [Phycisphaerales bacterium]